MPTVGVVSPGAMGSAIGAALKRGGCQVVVALEGRSDRTRQLAESAELTVARNLDDVIAEADVVLSIAPPEAAPTIAYDISRGAGRVGAQPLVADLNAISPATAATIAAELTANKLDFVDGSISGPPPWHEGTTRIYLAGARAADVAALPFDGVTVVTVGSAVGSASAVKMSTASVYKGSTALLLQALLAAHANGVLDHVLDDLRLGAPELVSRVERRLAVAASKSERYVGEMYEIAATQAAAGLAPSLFEAIAEVYASAARTELAQDSPEDVGTDLSLDDVLDGLR